MHARPCLGKHRKQATSIIQSSLNTSRLKGLRMDELDVMQDVADRLARLDVPYMLTGSMAMNFYAQPRMTRDIDIVVDIRRDEAGRVAALFEPDYYVSAEEIQEAVRHRFMFNIIHNESLIKVDFILRKEEPYRRVEFGRRRTVHIGRVEVSIVSKEDLILSKLHWARDSHSELQLRDVRNLLATGYDKAYLNHWLRELNLYTLAEPLLS